MDVLTRSTDTFRELAARKKDEFLLAEYGQRMDALLQNEDSGEKRAAFFVTLVGAAAGVFAFAFDGTAPFLSKAHVPAASFALSALLVLMGLMTLRRLVERDLTTDRHIFALRELRRLFVSEAEANQIPNAFGDLYERRDPRNYGRLSLGKGGWMHSVALINAVLGGVFVASAVRWAASASLASLISPAAAAIAVTWIAQLRFAENRMKALDDARKRDAVRCGNSA